MGKKVRLDAMIIAATGGYPENFDGIEIQVTYDQPAFYSVYIHYTEGGVEWVADFPELLEAREYAVTLAVKYRWPVTDFTE